MRMRVGFELRRAGRQVQGGLRDEDVDAEGAGGEFLACEAVADYLLRAALEDGGGDGDGEGGLLPSLGVGHRRRIHIGWFCTSSFLLAW